MNLAGQGLRIFLQLNDNILTISLWSEVQQEDSGETNTDSLIFYECDSGKIKDRTTESCAIHTAIILL